MPSKPHERGGVVALGPEKSMQVDDVVAHVRVVDGTLRHRLCNGRCRLRFVYPFI